VFFREKDTEILIVALKDSFGLVCSIYKCNKNYYIVIIYKEYVKILQTIVSPYNIPDLKDKIGLNKMAKSYYSIACSNSFGKRFYSTMNKSSRSPDNISSEPVTSYSNPVLLKSVIYKENLKKAVIYR